MREGAHYRTYKSWQALKDRCNRAKCITYNGITQSASMWAKSLGLAKGAVWNRIKLLGWDVERAVTTGKVG